MTTTINKPTRESHLRKPTRHRGGGTRTRSVAHHPHGMAGQPRTASSVPALVSGARAIAPVSLALIPLAVAFGATATGDGLSALETIAMSVSILGGAAQLAAGQLIATGASATVVVLSVLVIHLRLALYSASLAPHFRGLSAGWKGLLSYLINDPVYAATITRFDEGRIEKPDKRWYYLGVGLAVWVTWQAATMLGVFLGTRVPESWSLDFVSPLFFIALGIPAIKDRTTTAAALSAGAAALAVALPLNLGLIVATLAGVSGGLIVESLIQRRQG